MGKIVEEIVRKEDNDLVAFREGTRYVEEIREKALISTPNHPVVQDKGVYLISGGLGGSAMKQQEKLPDAPMIPRLLYWGRSALPDESEWQSITTSTTDTTMSES